MAFLSQHGQLLLPMVDLIEQSKVAVDELMEVVGRSAVEAVLRFSAKGVAGPKHQGQRGNGISWHGSQNGRVVLSERKLKVRRCAAWRRGQDS